LPYLHIAGVDCHIGSQLTEISPFIAAAEKILALTETLDNEGIHLEHIDMGGGLGIRYRDETPPAIADYVAALRGALRGRSERLILGARTCANRQCRCIADACGVSQHGEEKNFAIVDAAMNDLMRPALYDAFHEILPVCRQPSPQPPPMPLPTPLPLAGEGANERSNC